MKILYILHVVSYQIYRRRALTGIVLGNFKLGNQAQIDSSPRPPHEFSTSIISPQIIPIWWIYFYHFLTIL